MSQNPKVCVGVIMGAHGVRGQLRVRGFTEDPLSLFEYKPLTDESGEHKFPLKCLGAMAKYFVASLKGLADREAAEALRGTKLFVPRSALPPPEEGVYYEADLIGLAAKTGEEQLLGVVEAMHDYGAGSFLEIKPAKGKSFMVPFKDAFVPDVKIAEGTVTLVLPEGWLDEEKPPKVRKEKV